MCDKTMVTLSCTTTWMVHSTTARLHIMLPLDGAVRLVAAVCRLSIALAGLVSVDLCLARPREYPTSVSSSGISRGNRSFTIARCTTVESKFLEAMAIQISKAPRLAMALDRGLRSALNHTHHIAQQLPQTKSPPPPPKKTWSVAKSAMPCLPEYAVPGTSQSTALEAFFAHTTYSRCLWVCTYYVLHIGRPCTKYPTQLAWTTWGWRYYILCTCPGHPSPR